VEIIIKINRDFFDNYLKYLLSVVLIIVVFGVVLYNIKAAVPKVEAEGIKVSGMYNLDLKYEDIQDIKLEDTLPEGLRKVNGIDLFGTAYIGNFSSQNIDKIKVFVVSDKDPFIYITTKNVDYQYVIINRKEKNKTEELYNNIRLQIKR